MNFDNSLTVISTAITIFNVESNTIHKTPSECSNEELVKETFNQLKISFPNLPIPTSSIKYPYIENAYVFTTDNKFMNSKIYKNLYSVGTHNGNSFYHFTSLESAITNAITFIYEYDNKTTLKTPLKDDDINIGSTYNDKKNIKKEFPIKKPYSVKDFVKTFIYIYALVTLIIFLTICILYI